jgi:transposase
LIAAGKLPKVAIVACISKLLTILNAMLRDQASWNALKNDQSPKTA